MQEWARGRFKTFWQCSYILCLPCIWEWAEGVFVWYFDTVPALFTDIENVLGYTFPTYTPHTMSLLPSTSLMCNSETEVDLCHPQQTIDLTRPHSCVNWHSHCPCELAWSVLEPNPHMGVCVPTKPAKPTTPTYRNPYPYVRVRVFMGMGSPGIPQGYLWQSLGSGKDGLDKRATFIPHAALFVVLESPVS